MYRSWRSAEGRVGGGGSGCVGVLAVVLWWECFVFGARLGELVPAGIGRMHTPINSMGTNWQTVEGLLLDRVGILPARPLNIDNE